MKTLITSLALIFATILLMVGTADKTSDVVKEVEDLIDSEDYQSEDNILFGDSKSKIRYFDYWEPTTTQTSSTRPNPLKTDKGNNNRPKPGQSEDKVKEPDNQGEGDGSGTVIIIVVVVVIVLGLVLSASVAVFIYTRQTKTTLFGKKPKRHGSVDSLSSIKTISSETGEMVSKSKSTKAGPKVGPKPGVKGSATSLSPKKAKK